MNRILCILLIFIITAFILLGCKPAFQELTAPPDDMSIDDVTKINLRSLDLDKLSKTDINEIDGVSFSFGTVGYEMEYRYPDRPIKVRIIKFSSGSKLQAFWLEWLDQQGLNDSLSEQYIHINTGGKETVYAWQKGPWLTHISVPATNLELTDKVRTVIVNHYNNLAKK